MVYLSPLVILNFIIDSEVFMSAKVIIIIGILKKWQKYRVVNYSIGDNREGDEKNEDNRKTMITGL